MTEEERKAKETLEAQQRAATNDAQSQNKGIMDLIIGFLKFFFESFLGNSSDAPNEDPSDIPETSGSIARLGKVIIDAKAIPKWKAYQEAHKGEAVNFKNPVKGATQVTSGFGAREAPTAGASHNHAGVDLGARGGDKTPEIIASASGVVLFSGRKQGYGNTVMIGHADGSYTLYGHMDGTKMPAVGNEVAQGQTIGEMGASGTATAVHLHFEQRRGSAAVQPQLAGVGALRNGMQIAPSSGNALAGLVNPNDHPNLAVGSGHKPPIAMRAPNTAIGGIRIS
jgi:murein DD-endopeptidase MepM/ murein hydrolase activator NlpD